MRHTGNVNTHKTYQTLILFLQNLPRMLVLAASNSNANRTLFMVHTHNSLTNDDYGDINIKLLVQEGNTHERLVCNEKVS